MPRNCVAFSAISLADHLTELPVLLLIYCGYCYSLTAIAKRLQEFAQQDHLVAIYILHVTTITVLK